jgi:hypothetical protein
MRGGGASHRSFFTSQKQLICHVLTRNEIFGLFALWSGVDCRAPSNPPIDLSLVCAQISSPFLRRSFPDILWPIMDFLRKSLCSASGAGSFMRCDNAWCDSPLNKASSIPADAWLCHLTFGFEIQFTIAVGKTRSYVDQQSSLQASSKTRTLTLMHHTPQLGPYL